MSLADAPLLSTITARLHHLSARQRLIAENVANADTAGYTPRDLTPFRVEARAGGAATPVTTHARHLTGRGLAASGTHPFKPVETSGSERTLDGNSVVLEEEMIK